MICQVWRHTCLSMSRTTGKFKLVENGHLLADKFSEDIIKYMAKIPVEVKASTLFSSLWLCSSCNILGKHPDIGLLLPKGGG